MFSTKTKIVWGYILSGLLILATIIYIYDKISLLTGSNSDDPRIDKQKEITNDIIEKLYRIEIAGMSLSTGEYDEYDIYKKNMLDVRSSIDTLRSITTDSTQKTRLDSVSILLKEKEMRMSALLYAIKQNNADSLYRHQIEAIINEQDSIATRPRVIHKIVTHTQVRTEEERPKNFLRRLGKLFSSGKDSAIIKDTIHEEYIDTMSVAYNNADSIATLLKQMHERAALTRQQQTALLNKNINSVQRSSMELSAKVQQLLKTIEDEENERSRQREGELTNIRNRSAYILGAIAIAAVALATIFIIMIWRDITRSNKYRKDLEKAKEQAEALLKTREQLMLTITHDIKAPTGSIIGYSELLEKITHDERQRFYLGNMQSSANHLLQLVNSLLDFYKLDAQKTEEQNVPFNPKDMFDSIATSYIPTADKKGIELNYNCDSTADGFFMGDPFHIRQITENILSNAIKFTKQGNVGMNIKICDDTLHIGISDTGCGIPKDEQKNMFKEFTRLKNAQGAEGFGLGLAITSKLTKLLHGKIDFESKEGEGTKFHITLPLKKCPFNAPEKEPADNTTQETAPLNLLIIDDDRIQLQLTTAMLDGSNINITCCEHTQEMLEYMNDNTYDIILTDIQMPEADGFEIYDIIRRLPHQYAHDVPIVAVTARHDIDTDELKKKGFAHCIHKPFTQKELINSIAEVSGADATVDFSSLTAFSMDDDDATKEIMQTFIVETEKMRVALEEALVSNDMKKTTEITHRLLPLFKMLNATNAAKQSEWFEARRHEETMTQEAKNRIAHIIKDTNTIIAQAKRKIKNC